MSLDKVKKKKKNWNVFLKEIYKVRNFYVNFNFWIFFLKLWISRRVSYFVGILSEIRYIFLSGCPQVLFLLNIEPRDISKPYKSPVQIRESSYR